MNAALLGIEFRKLRRSRIGLLLLLAVVILWLPSVLNAHMNFEMQPEGISPEHNFLIQGFMGMAWFLFPASMVVCTVLLTQTERSGGGLLKMRTLPLSMARLCLSKFMVLLSLAALQAAMSAAVYAAAAAIASRREGYDFLLPAQVVLMTAGRLWLSAVPMLAVFWMLAVWVRTPAFSVGLGLASIVPSVLVINTKVWFGYPMAYPFYVVVSQYGQWAENLSTAPVTPLPWLPVAAGITAVCLFAACARFGRDERS